MTKDEVRTIVREELRDNKIYDMPVQIAEINAKVDGVNQKVSWLFALVLVILTAVIAQLFKNFF